MYEDNIRFINYIVKSFEHRNSLTVAGNRFSRVFNRVLTEPNK